MQDKTRQLIAQDHAHVWHPFTPMRQWCESDPLIIESGEGFELIDTEGRRYIDGVSSLWCNVHGHRVPEIDHAIREQLDKIAHSTMLGLGNVPSIELAAKLIKLTDKHLPSSHSPLRRVFYSDAGATALEVAFKMAVGHWFHRGKPEKKKFIGMHGAYHGDTVGSMSVGYSDLFHRAFQDMTFEVDWFSSPVALGNFGQDARPSVRCKTCKGEARVCDRIWPSECQTTAEHLEIVCVRSELAFMLSQHGEETAAVVIEPVMQGAAGMVCQPPGFVERVRELCHMYDVLLIADEVATGFGRTGAMFACERDGVTPDILCLAKGLTGGYLPVAATLTTDEIYDSFCGELDEKKTLYHGHTYTGNPLGCAAAIATLDLFEQNNTLANAQANAALITEKLNALRDHPHVLDIRQRGLMVGIELCQSRDQAEPFDFSKRTGAAVCAAARARGLIIRPLGDIVVLMPAPGMDQPTLTRMLDIVVETIQSFDFS